MKFKIGDKVKLIDNLRIDGTKFDYVTLGKIYLIIEIYSYRIGIIDDYGDIGIYNIDRFKKLPYKRIIKKILGK